MFHLKHDKEYVFSQGSVNLHVEATHMYFHKQRHQYTMSVSQCPQHQVQVYLPLIVCHWKVQGDNGSRGVMQGLGHCSSEQYVSHFSLMQGLELNVKIMFNIFLFTTLQKSV